MSEATKTDRISQSAQSEIEMSDMSNGNGVYGSTSKNDKNATPRSRLQHSIALARKIIVLVVGSTVVLMGVVMIIAPGPATVVIPAGLAILATEFIWARRLLEQARSTL